VQRNALLVAIASIVLVFAPVATGADVPSIDRAAWREDFAQIRAAIASHDANLEWSVRTRHLDLAQLVTTTDGALEAARTDDEARSALLTFLKAFGDGHLVLTWQTTGTASATPGATSAPGDLCTGQGYGPPTHHSAGVDFSTLPAYTAVPSAGSQWFPTGTLHLANGLTVGVLRIQIFGARWYPELCTAVLPGLGLSASSACDDACGDHVQVAAENLLTRRYTDAITALERSHVDALVVNLTANGGGSDWEEVAARELSARHLIAPHEAFVRSPHWVSEFQQQRADVLADLPKAKDTYRQLLQQAAQLAAAGEREAAMNCDRAPLWNDLPISCTQVADAGAFTTGSLGWAAPGSLPNVPSAEDVFYPSVYAYSEGVYSGPLFVLVDGKSASASERFAAMLQDAHVARILGSHTFGAGCGYTDGGIPTTLGHSQATLEMADCVQLRADGSNAVAGITPDVLVPWRADDNTAQRAQRAVDVLADVVR
jgi:hypothetical protein